MADALRVEWWDHTAAIAATLINVNRGKAGPQVTAAELNPYRSESAAPKGLRINADNIDFLKAFCPGVR